MDDDWRIAALVTMADERQAGRRMLLVVQFQVHAVVNLVCNTSRRVMQHR